MADLILRVQSNQITMLYNEDLDLSLPTPRALARYEAGTEDFYNVENK